MEHLYLFAKIPAIMSPKFSFVLPAYKASYLNEAIDSILNQTYADFELIVVNDASPEDIDSIVSKFSDSRIVYYENSENIGGKDLVDQWNHCLSYANGAFIILASDDDVYDPYYLAEINRLICKYPQCDVFSVTVSLINSKGNIIREDKPIQEFETYNDYVRTKLRGWVTSNIASYCFRRDALEKIGGFVKFPLAWHTDVVTVISLAKNGVATSPHRLFGFRASGISISTTRNCTSVMFKKLQSHILCREFMEVFRGGGNGDCLDAFYRDGVGSTIACTKLRAVLCNMQSISRMTGLPMYFVIRKVIAIIRNRLKSYASLMLVAREESAQRRDFLCGRGRCTPKT